MPKITVIMPSRNVKKYIAPCMDSVLNQTLTDMEILAIDAGSTDGTLEILQNYARQDGRIKILLSDKKSYGYQLNLGIAKAAGDYIGIVETDDRILPDMYETLYEKAAATGADYVKGTGQMYWDHLSAVHDTGNITCFPEPLHLTEQMINPSQTPLLLTTDRYLWLGIYRRDFIKSIRLSETPGAAFQDIGFLFQTIISAKSAVYLNKKVYLYRQDNADASGYNKNGFHYLAEEYTRIEPLIKEKSTSWQEAYYQRMWNQCISRFAVMAASGEYWTHAEPDMSVLQQRLQYALHNGILRIAQFPPAMREKLQLFIEHPQALYKKLCNILQSKKENIRQLLLFTENQEVIIFGAGKWGLFLHLLLICHKSCSVLAFCDNNKNLYHAKQQGLPVMSPQTAAADYPNAFFVIANSTCSDHIAVQLSSLQIPENHIFRYTAGINMTFFNPNFLNDLRSS